MKKFLKVFLLLCVIGGAIVGYMYYPKAMLYFNGKELTSASADVVIYVPTGSTVDQLASQLKRKGVIKEEAFFLNYAMGRNLKESTLEPGKYLVTKGMTYDAMTVNFRMGYGEEEVVVTYTNCRTIEDVSSRLCANIELEEAVFLNYVNSTEIIEKYGFNKESFRTFFIPNSFNVYWDISKEELVERLAAYYKTFWTADRRAKASKMGLTQSQVGVLASIVLSETVKMDEAPIIAGVYVNRLRKGITLDADPTLKWALGDFTIQRILNKDKKIDSPYNTYKNRGLPPGPIYISPQGYIDAVLNYSEHDYIFFCAKEDFSGYSNFAVTYREHQKNARKYQKALNDKKIYR